MFREFKKFILRGNLVELAIGFTVGASFSTVAKSLVNDIIMPPISALLGSTDFSDLFIVMKPGKTPPPYETLQDATSAGAVTWNYGMFINNLLALLVVAIAMFLIIHFINRLDDQLDEIKGKKEDEKKPTHRKCPFCLTTIPYKAKKCSACTSELPKPQK